MAVPQVEGQVLSDWGARLELLNQVRIAQEWAAGHIYTQRERNGKNPCKYERGDALGEFSKSHSATSRSA